ncbi:E3 ubiquitin-protein ligase RGLG2-like [Rosa rugosa]|uniref:E3 ubiquitin-protein ligase RGLG2-like n=1 Tax=Rosa rugosa TaxID=74645 RepID=UPI002B40FBA9|nr:E3 ubiquitin-protein ligase RGLG2-like [Rosa rugosa]XP_062010235.1 E3 ubiquitin-protein ligase RGLG2-like [Rosa rugosa]XP_062010236.1 E3 ubiquitin-protein ligase RGLG2-like [Rosa rugosa]
MGGRSSKEDGSLRQNSYGSRSSSSSWSGYPPVQSPYVESQGYAPQQSYPPSQYSYPPPRQDDGQETQAYHPPQQPSYPSSSSQYSNPPQQPPDYGGQRKLDRRYSRIADSYNSLEEVTEALARAGLESSNLIVGIDFTKSNEWTGKSSYNRRSLHHIGDGLNPYEHAITIIGKTLAAFDEDNMIPCYGFGDATTHDQDVFSFYPNDQHCNGFEEVLTRYKEIVPHLRLAGPTSFAPVIEMAMTIVEQSGGQYHVLLIIADGQVTRSVDTERGRLSSQEQKTVDAIVEASKFPLSIILVGVGDGPWDMMKEFDDNIPARAFDNFQFVNFTEIMSKKLSSLRKETEFALAALMEIPTQYKATIELNLLGGQKGNSPHRVPLPPPLHGASLNSSKPLYGASSFSSSKPSHPSVPPYYEDSSSKPSHEPSVPPYYEDSSSFSTASAPPATSSTYDNQVCPICLTNSKDMAFGCGHQTCCECGQDLQTCPICRSPIQTRIKLY